MPSGEKPKTVAVLRPGALRRKPLVSVLELYGTIGAVGVSRRSLSHHKTVSAIEAAFKPRRLSAVALAINSPGGSAVQSRLIHGSIRRAAERRKIPVYAFIEDAGASGGYILALAADEIYADGSSVIGSIGALAATFGFNEAIARLGVERRVYAAGEHKAALDPFRPENPEDVLRLKEALDDIHRQFIELVRERRGARLSGASDTFSGAFWTAKGALDRGLIDGVRQFGDFVREKFGEDVRIRRFSPERLSLLRRLFSGTGGT
jgi:serine protease SohB